MKCFVLKESTTFLKIFEGRISRRHPFDILVVSLQNWQMGLRKIGIEAKNMISLIVVSWLSYTNLVNTPFSFFFFLEDWTYLVLLLDGGIQWSFVNLIEIKSGNFFVSIYINIRNLQDGLDDLWDSTKVMLKILGIYEVFFQI